MGNSFDWTGRGLGEATTVFLLMAISFMAGTIWEASGWGARAKVVSRKICKSLRPGPGGVPQGKCRLVGAGPGDTALLTLAARQALVEADIVIADLLVSPETLKLVKGKLVMSRKYKGCANKAQDELHRWTLQALKEGKDVVRIKGGDPFLYGRGAEEIEVFRKAGFQVQVIPGISSCLAAPLAAGIAVTTRGVADQLIVATGHGMNDTIPRDIAPYYAGRTTVYLMSVSRMQQLMQKLTEPHIGYPSKTPVAVIERATTANQRVVYGCVEDIARICAAEGVESPATIVVGRAARALEHSALDNKGGHSTYVVGEGATFHPLPLCPGA